MLASVLLSCALAPAPVLFVHSTQDAFDPAQLHRLARELAGAEPRQVEAKLPARLADLDYDGYRSIRFRRDRRPWSDEDRAFQLDALHLGSIYRIPVRIDIVDGGTARELPFSPEFFEYPEGFEAPTEPLRFSGVRLHYPLNRPDRFDEFLVFQGGSYFRAVGRGQTYGSSARGLALRTADPAGEEFPAFTRFWVEAPRPDAARVRLHALLESKSVVGVFTFEAQPGQETVVDIDATLYPRVELEHVGLGALTSMYLFDAGQRPRADDFRRAVCDASGLQMITGADERLWRPLTNPKRLEVSSFQDRNPRGFGLTQRRRDFDDFGDMEARYHERPSVWVEPLGNWGEGSVMLVEIPLEGEFNDNIVALWRPAQPLPAGEPFRYAYRLRWGEVPPDAAPLARVAATRTGLAPNDRTRLYVIDFQPPPHRGLGEPAVDATTSVGRVVRSRLEVLPSGELRVTLEFDPGDAPHAELSVRLVHGDEPVSERWLYRWTRS